MVKSIVKSSQTFFGIGKGCNSPICFCGGYLLCWQITHKWRNYLVSLYMLGQKKEVAKRAMVGLMLEWLKVGVQWFSRIKELHKSLKSRMKSCSRTYKRRSCILDTTTIEVLKVYWVRRAISRIKLLQMPYQRWNGRWGERQQEGLFLLMGKSIHNYVRLVRFIQNVKVITL